MFFYISPGPIATYWGRWASSSPRRRLDAYPRARGRVARTRSTEAGTHQAMLRTAAPSPKAPVRTSTRPNVYRDRTASYP